MMTIGREDCSTASEFVNKNEEQDWVLEVLKYVDFFVLVSEG